MKNEVMEMIAKIRERKGRLDLPIVSGKHLRKISDRTAKSMHLALQSEYDSIGKEQTKIATESVYAEVISCNKKNLEREL